MNEEEVNLKLDDIEAAEAAGEEAQIKSDDKLLIDESTDDDPFGTPYYLAPEIWRTKSYSKESDIWALGVILYELLHFKKPFPANDKAELIEKVYT